ncbi:MAG: hypothetical protein N2036_09355, partial [Bryobacteraceae bacterium]|nr:hypothetical protein [Bryobacteraceae bacterium]
MLTLFFPAQLFLQHRQLFVFALQQEHQPVEQLAGQPTLPTLQLAAHSPPEVQDIPPQHSAGRFSFVPVRPDSGAHAMGLHRPKDRRFASCLAERGKDWP